MKVSKYKNIAIFLGAFIVFLLSFQNNFFNAATKSLFKGHERFSEALVLGRMIETQNNGYMSHGGFLGRHKIEGFINFQYEAFLNNKFPDSGFRPYRQSFGLQGYFYASIDSVLRFVGLESGATRLYLNKLVTSSLFAALLVLFVYFIKHNFGYLSAITFVFLVATSQWVVVHSNNLYWMFFLVILPFIIVTTFLQLNIQDKKTLLIRRINLLYISVFFAVLIKSLSGYEYISTVLIATVTPLIFFAIRDTWDAKAFLVRFLSVGLSGVAGFFTAILMHLKPLTNVQGSLTKGFEHLWGTIAKRTHGDPNMVAEVYRTSLESNIINVILKYFNGRAFNLDSLIGFGGYITFWELIITFFIMSTVITFLTFSLNGYKKYKKLNLAAAATLWFSFLAPLSWYILAKGHSYLHQHINHVLWYVPFLLIGFAYFGFVISLIIPKLINFSIKKNFIVLGILLSLLIFVYLLKIYRENKYYKIFIDNSYEGQQLNLDKKLSIIYNKNEIVFISERCDPSLSTSFFLHIIPKEIDDLPKSSKQYNFENLDFNWSSKEKYFFTPHPLGQKSCAASIQLPSYPAKGIRTGQFNKKDGRLWERYIDLMSKRFISDFQAFNLTDRNWVNGVSRLRSGFFIENTFANRQSIRVGDKLTFNHSGRRVIEKISHSSSYINIFVSGGKLTPELDGYPHPIKITQEGSE